MRAALSAHQRHEQMQSAECRVRSAECGVQNSVHGCYPFSLARELAVLVFPAERLSGKRLREGDRHILLRGCRTGKGKSNISYAK